MTSRTVLLVDDDALIRAIGRDALDALGYEARTAADGAQALTAALECPRVVILDENLPDMTGLNVLRALRDRWPELPIILSTGKLRDTPTRLAHEGWSAVLPKPYTLADLAAMLARFID